MSLPRKNIVHVKKVMVDISKCPCEPKTAPCAMDWCLTSHHWGSCPAQFELCVDNCPACLEAARDKEWADWILEELTSTTHDGSGRLCYIDFRLMPEDFEALKKLIEG